MVRRVSWFSCGAASAVATKLSDADEIVYCETGSEDVDNKRFMNDCSGWFGKEIKVLKSEKYNDTWDVWEKKKYISGIHGAPCTSELKVALRVAFQRPDDVHIFGYTADADDVRRAETLKENWPELKVQYPLIESGIQKAGCIALLQNLAIVPPRVYEMGFPNANCIPCCKATSPAYWALVRYHFPDKFERMAKLSRSLDARLTRINGERAFIDEIPKDHGMTEPLAPECDFLCGLAEQQLRQDN